MKNKEPFGLRHKDLRMRAKMSLDEVARAASMSKSGVWEIETGRNDPRLSTMRKLARALGVPLWQLLSHEDCEADLSDVERRVILAMRHSEAP